jgi:hypothetical protein
VLHLRGGEAGGHGGHALLRMLLPGGEQGGEGVLAIGGRALASRRRGVAHVRVDWR